MFRLCPVIQMALCLSACGGLPPLDGRSESTALLTRDSADTRLGRDLAARTGQHPGLSGVVPLSDPLDAFTARMLLIAAADRAIDVQYYIWRDDITGNLLLQALQDAAARKVRVRLLLDDNGIAGLDDKLARLASLEHVEVRLFNPFPNRRFKPLGFLTDFSRLNRRMHNKSLTVDGQVTVVGGRNIGDEYFGATLGVAFADLDVMVTGAVVDEVSVDFDRYWHSSSAYPVDTLLPPAGRQPLPPAAARPGSSALDPGAQIYLQAVARSRFVDDLLADRLAIEWAPVRMVSDDPGKVLDQAPSETLLLARLMQLLDRPAESVDLISPYFVPTRQGVDAFGRLADQGVRVRVLTNAMEATDVLAVHAGYARYRKPLLEQGVVLYEMRRQRSLDAPKEKAGPFGSSGSSLHAKTFAVDGKRVFVGSFNFDPRSARLNTELGFVIESSAMARAVAGAFDGDMLRHAYRVEIDQGELVWLEHAGTDVRRLTTEPSASWWRRLYLRFLSLLPIEPLL
jgi:putative cardiolipin synthase